MPNYFTASDWQPTIWYSVAITTTSIKNVIDDLKVTVFSMAVGAAE